ncbi:hypothetical protein AB0H43_26760 [Hamadaea sp. NPDC050747]|uniref:hypothetical protein n=1 Tax=Hamadaea sp. NPDC050747 TaxID=3155789 RepID=UPI0033F44DE7
MVVAPEQVVGLVEFEVGAGRVEEQQIDFEVEQVGDAVVDRPGQRRFDTDQVVHRPVAGIVGDRRQAGQMHVVADPLRCRQLARRLERSVGDQREQHPFDVDLTTASVDHVSRELVDAQLGPQAIEQPHSAQRPRLQERQPRRTQRAARSTDTGLP